MATDIYLQLDGIKGESTDSKHKDWVEISSYTHKITQPASVTARSGGGANSGRSQHEPFILIKPHDLASAKIFDACCTGKYLKSAKLEKMVAVGADKAKQVLIELDNVVVASFELDFDEKTQHHFERIALNYGVIKWTYTQTKGDGTAGGNVAAGYSCQEGKAV
jgi:type VI secretion system secreted protein Hcp